MAVGSGSAGRDRVLIVNADDFGRSEEVNRGVAEGFRHGIITSTSIVAAAPAFAQAVEIARELKGLGVGLHLAANEYAPLLTRREIPSLVARDGNFLPRSRLFLKMAVDPRTRGDLMREWGAQISKVMDAGIRLTHLDGHGHCHAHPRAAGVVLELARRYKIAHVRMPAEAITWRPDTLTVARQAGKLLTVLACIPARRLWRGKLCHPDWFYGFSDAGRVTPALIRRIAENAPSGVSELMVHVGVSNREAPGFYTGYDWMGDLKAVRSFAKEEFEHQFGVSLVRQGQGRNGSS